MKLDDFSRWQLPKWANGVIYQVYPMSFQATNGAIGDLEGILKRLRYLAWLGVRYIWTNPIYESPLRDNGYDVSNGRAINPRFGTLATFQRLVEEAHKLGVGVTEDLPLCHVSDEHEWFRRARRGERKYLEYFIVRPGKNGAPPNNWRRKFPDLVDGKPVPSSAWTRMPGDGDTWYMNTWAPYMPLLNLRNPDVQREQVDMMSFWLEQGVAGFRLDYVPNACPDLALTDNPPNPKWHEGMPWDEALLTTYTEYTDDMYKTVADIVSAVVRRHPQAFLLPEAYPPGLGRIPTAYQRFYQSLDPWHAAPLNFQLMFVQQNAPALQTYLNEYYAALPPHCVNVPTLSNHDRPRPASESEFGKDGSMSMTMMLLLLPGMPGLYYGQELAMPSFYIPPHLDLDPQGGRFRSRTPMPWGDDGDEDVGEPNFGFCPPDVEPWLPVSVPSGGTVAAQRRNPRAPLHVVQSAIRLRGELPALGGGIEPFAPGDFTDMGVVAFTRSHGGESAHVLTNRSPEPRSVDVGSPMRVLLRSSGVPGSGRLERRVVLRANETVLLVLSVRCPGPGGPGHLYAHGQTG